MRRLLCLLLVVPRVMSAQPDISGDYTGHIDLGTMRLKVVVHLQEDDRRLSGTIDIPEQQAKGLKLDNIKLKSGELSYTIPEVPGNATFNGRWKPEADSINGTFSQSGMSFTMLTGKTGTLYVQKTKLSQAARLSQIEAYIDTVMRKGKVAGCAVGIIHNGEILMNRGFGYRDLEQKISCDQQTLFAIGSCTKAFTAAVLASLYDEGVFDWEKPVKGYVPYFGMKDRFADEQINGIDICTHRSGLPRHDLIWYGSSLTRRELVERIRHLEPNKPFRTTWQYNNFMYLTAGVVAEEITKESWENLVQKRIFAPLGMKSSIVRFNEFTASGNRAIAYEEKDGKIQKIDYRNIEAMGPAGSVFSNTTDMLEWLRFLLNEGSVNDQQVLSAAQIEFLLSPKMVMEAGPEFKQPAYAMGWIVSQYKGKTFIEHGGNIDGFSADVVLLPEENIGIVVLANKDGSSIPALLSLYITDRLLDHEEYDWYEEKIGKPQRMAETARRKKKEETGTPERKKNKKPEAKKTRPNGPAHALKDYAGEYSDPAYGTLSIKWTGKELVFAYNAIQASLEHDSFETFTANASGENIKMAFFTNVNGKIEWLQVQLGVLSAPVTFYKKVPDYLSDKNYMNTLMGRYDMGGLTLTLSTRGNKFMASLSDGQEYELVPAGDDLFKLKELEGFTMEMVFDEKGSCIKVISHQPNGDFEAKRVE